MLYWDTFCGYNQAAAGLNKMNWWTSCSLHALCLSSSKCYISHTNSNHSTHENTGDIQATHIRLWTFCISDTTNLQLPTISEHKPYLNNAGIHIINNARLLDLILFT
jgi:hypothetical protein